MIAPCRGRLAAARPRGVLLLLAVLVLAAAQVPEDEVNEQLWESWLPPLKKDLSSSDVFDCNDVQQVVQAANGFRRRHDAPRLEWSQELAEEAKEQLLPASVCRSSAPPEQNATAPGAELPGYGAGYVGADPFASRASYKCVAAVNDFYYSERDLSYAFAEGLEAGGAAVAPALLLWRNVTDVGCALRACGASKYVAYCMFGPHAGSFTAKELEANLAEPAGTCPTVFQFSGRLDQLKSVASDNGVSTEDMFCYAEQMTVATIGVPGIAFAVPCPDDAAETAIRGACPEWDLLQGLTPGHCPTYHQLLPGEDYASVAELYTQAVSRSVHSASVSARDLGLLADNATGSGLPNVTYTFDNLCAYNPQHDIVVPPELRDVEGYKLDRCRDVPPLQSLISRVMIPCPQDLLDRTHMDKDPAVHACPDQQVTLDTINDLRARHDLAPLQWDAEIEEELRTRLGVNATLVCGNPEAVGVAELFDFFPSMRLAFSQRASGPLVTTQCSSNPATVYGTLINADAYAEKFQYSTNELLLSPTALYGPVVIANSTKKIACTLLECGPWNVVSWCMYDQLVKKITPYVEYEYTEIDYSQAGYLDYAEGSKTKGEDPYDDIGDGDGTTSARAPPGESRRRRLLQYPYEGGDGYGYDYPAGEKNFESYEEYSLNAAQETYGLWLANLTDPSSSCPTVYFPSDTDTLLGVAEAFGLQADELLCFNNQLPREESFRMLRSLELGLMIPCTGTVDLNQCQALAQLEGTCNVTHVVQPGEHVAGIAAAYDGLNLTAAELCCANGMTGACDVDTLDNLTIPCPTGKPLPRSCSNIDVCRTPYLVGEGDDSVDALVRVTGWPRESLCCAWGKQEDDCAVDAGEVVVLPCRRDLEDMGCPAETVNELAAAGSSAGDDDGSSNLGMILGIAIGVPVALLLLALLGLFAFMRRRRAQQQLAAAHSKGGPGDGGYWDGGDDHNEMDADLVKIADMDNSKVFEEIASLDWHIKTEELEVCARPDGSEWVLGKGAFSTVYRAVWMQGMHVAVKRLNTTMDSDKQLRTFAKEVTILRSCRSPYIVQFLGASVQKDAITLVTELMAGGNLTKAIAHEAVTWHKRGHRIALEVAQGLHYLHMRNVLHLDIKSANVLLAGNGAAKIADVGLAHVLLETFAKTEAHMQGTWAWMAPEVITGERVTAAADVYSYGVTLWEIVMGEQPLRGDLQKPSVPGHCPQEVADLIARCTSSDSAQRPSMLEVIEELRALPTSGRASMSGNSLTKRESSLTRAAGSSPGASPPDTHSRARGAGTSASAAGTSEPTDPPTRTHSGGSGPLEPPSPTTCSRSASAHASGQDARPWDSTGSGSRGRPTAAMPPPAAAKAVPASPFVVDEIPSDVPDPSHDWAAVPKTLKSPFAVDEGIPSFTDGSVSSRPASPVAGPLASPFTPDELPLSMQG